MEKITDIDSMKFRTSTHLAGVDVEAMENPFVTIKEAYYGKDVQMNGKKSAGYFIEFIEDIKPMCVNSGNRKTINQIVKTLRNCTSVESRNLTNWVGIKLELYFEPNRSFAGVKTGGIGIKQNFNIIDDKIALQKLNGSKTLIELQEVYLSLTPEEKKYPSIIKLKDELKTKLA